MAKRARTPSTSQAARADRFALYQEAVQTPAHEVSFFARAFKDAHRGVPTVLREDFCGTAAIAAAWVQGSDERRAYAIDHDPAPLAWGRAHNLAPLPLAAQQRIELICDDVLHAATPPADVVSAQNFSFFAFDTRDDLRTYFAGAFAALKERGVLVLDVLGGAACLSDDRVDVRRCRGFDYVWQQLRFDPISNKCHFRIHFRFSDGSELPGAFEYHWRLWSIAELRELLGEAGFARSEVYWEGKDTKNGGHAGVYKRRSEAPASPCWVAYVVGVKGG